jgi:hypothetical protein
MARRSLNCEDSLDLRFQFTQRRHHDVGGAVLIRALESQYDIAGAGEFEPFIGDMAQVGDDFSRDVSPDNPGAFQLASDFHTNPATPRVS